MVDRYKMNGKTLQKWKEVPVCGEPLMNGLFLPFKTPFDNTHISEEIQFTTEMCYDLFHLKEVDVGLVIDLTGTDRYYDKAIFEDKKIQHFKLPWKIWDEPPTREETAIFISKCKSFRKQNPKKCIGVHCNTGLHRTGFFICAYLVEVLKMDVWKAIELFRKARWPGIEKAHMREELISRYNARFLLKRISKIAGFYEEKPKIFTLKI